MNVKDRAKATAKNIENKIHEVIDDLTGDSETELEAREHQEEVDEQVTSLGNKAKATAKNIEGKAQETLGVLTDNPKTQLEGKGKQIEAKIGNAIEEVKDNLRKPVN